MIYTYCGIRQQVHPILLNRNLSYMLSEKKMEKLNRPLKKIDYSDTSKKRKRLNNIIKNLTSKQKQFTSELSKSNDDIIIIDLEDEIENNMDFDSDFIIKFEIFKLRDPLLSSMIKHLIKNNNNENLKDILSCFLEFYAYTNIFSSNKCIEPMLIGKCPINVGVGDDQPVFLNKNTFIKTSVSSLQKNRFDSFFLRLILISKCGEKALVKSNGHSSEIANNRKRKSMHLSNENAKKLKLSKNSVLNQNKKRLSDGADLSTSTQNNYACQEFYLNILSDDGRDIKTAQTNSFKTFDYLNNREYSFTIDTSQCEVEKYIKASSLKDIVVPKLQISLIKNARFVSLNSHAQSVCIFISILILLVIHLIEEFLENLR